MSALAAARRNPGRTGGQSGRPAWWRLAVLGLGAGFANGFLGTGGGSLIVPLLVFWLHTPERPAHGSALPAVMLTSVVSAVVYMRHAFVNWDLSFKVALGGMVGAYVGARLTQRLHPLLLRRIFAFFMLVAAVRMLWGR